MDGLMKFVVEVNGILWGWPMIILLVGAGIIFTFALGFPQVLKLPQAFKKTFGGMFSKEKTKEGSMSSFQSLATAVAAQVGTGNVAGVATAIIAGGPGAIFWMWLAAFFGMGTIFVEAVLAQKYRERKEGNLVGGPAYYLKNGFSEFKNETVRKFGKAMAVFFAITIVIALGFVGNMVQSNSISTAINTAFGLKPLYAGIIIAILAALIFIGGMERIAKFAEFVVPLMALIYIIGSIVVCVMYASELLPTLKSIFSEAFSTKAAAGGAMGTIMKQAIRYGVARGLFSNEAGMGSTPNSHAVAEVKHPYEQGLAAIVGVFVDTILVCSATSLSILVTKSHLSGLKGVSVTQEAFNRSFGKAGVIFLAICLTFFAFTTVVGWYYFGENNIKFLFTGKSAIRVYQVLVVVFIILGSAFKVDLVWEMADMFNGFMVIPNLIGILVLFKEARKLKNEYVSKYNAKEDITYNYIYENEKNLPKYK